jgi:enediyne biosynthesis protein E7
MTRDRPTLMSRLAGPYDAVRLPLGPQALYYFARPEHAQHVLARNADNYEKGIGQSHARRALGRGLLTNEGASWRRARASLRPAFAQERVPLQASIVDTEAVRLTHRLASAGIGDRLPLNVQETLVDYTLRVLGPALIGRDLMEYTELGSAFDVVQDQAIFEMMTLNSVPAWLPTRRRKRFREALRYLDRVVDDLVATHDTVSGQDLVSLVLAQPLSEAELKRQLRDELVTMLLAGHETTASTLSWAIGLVGKHPHVHSRIRDEARLALGPDATGAADADRAIKALPYTAAVIHEVARLYPAVWLLSRKALADDTVGGYHVPAGAQVLICPYALHRDPRYWDAPEEFNPDRFLGAFPAESRYAYIPFGAGPRSCIGRSMGLTEAIIALARVCRDVDFAVQAHNGRAEGLMTLRPADPLFLTVLPSQEGKIEPAPDGRSRAL